MMDRDYPPTPRQTRVTLLGLVVIAVIGILLFGGLIPGLHPNYSSPTTVTYDGHVYYYASVPVPWAPIGSNFSTPERLLLHNVTFWVWVTNWYSLTGGVLRGNVTVLNGSVYSFALGSPEVNRTYSPLFESPGGAVVVVWAGGLDFQPLVEVPAAGSTPD